MVDLKIISTSRAEDAGYLAMADVAATTEALGIDYRLIGGHMVSMLVRYFKVTGVPDRETADADLAVEWSVVSDPRLPVKLKAMGYKQAESNRFVRKIDNTMAAVIDVLTISPSRKHIPNQPHGDLFVDEIPGLDLALFTSPITLDLGVVLTTGIALTVQIRIPAPLPALCLKLMAYRSRLDPKDAVDVWRLLAVCHSAGVTATGWPKRVTARDAAVVLADFTAINSHVLRVISSDRSIQTRIRALAKAVGPSGDYLATFAR